MKTLTRQSVEHAADVLYSHSGKLSHEKLDEMMFGQVLGLEALCYAVQEDPQEVVQYYFKLTEALYEG